LFGTLFVQKQRQFSQFLLLQTLLMLPHLSSIYRFCRERFCHRVFGLFKGFYHREHYKSQILQKFSRNSPEILQIFVGLQLPISKSRVTIIARVGVWTRPAVATYLEMMGNIFVVIARVPLIPINQSASARHLAAFASILSILHFVTAFEMFKSFSDPLQCH
jgi:hypothetical protein